MNFSFLLGLCLFDIINAKYLLVNVDEEQQVRGPKPPAPLLVTKPPVPPKRPLPTCIQPGGKCFGKTKLSISIEFSARSVKGPAECCQGYTCVSGMCLKPQITIDGLGKMSGIENKDPACKDEEWCNRDISLNCNSEKVRLQCPKACGGCDFTNFDQKKAASEPQEEKAARDFLCQEYGEVCMGDWECCSQMCEDDTCVGIGDK